MVVRGHMERIGQTRDNIIVLNSYNNITKGQGACQVYVHVDRHKKFGRYTLYTQHACGGLVYLIFGVDYTIYGLFTICNGDGVTNDSGQVVHGLIVHYLGDNGDKVSDILD